MLRKRVYRGWRMFFWCMASLATITVPVFAQETIERIAHFFPYISSPAGYAVSGDILYAADSQSGLHLWDIGDPDYIRALPHELIPHMESEVIRRVGDTLILGMTGHFRDTTYIFDISSPAEPVLISRITFRGDLIGADEHRLAYRTARGSNDSLRIWDWTDPTAPVLTHAFLIHGEDALAAEFVGDEIAVAGEGLMRYDLTVPGDPDLIAWYRPYLTFSSFAIRDNRLYLPSPESTLTVLEYDTGVVQTFGIDSTEANRVLLAEIDGRLIALLLAGPYCPQPNRLTSVDVHHPGHQVILDQMDFSWTNLATTAAALVGPDQLALHAENMLDLIDLSDPCALQRIAEFGGCRVYEIELVPPCMYVATGDDGTRIVDVSNPAAPSETGRLAEAASMHVLGDRLYLDGHYWLDVYDISDPFQPLLVSTLPALHSDYEFDAAWRYPYRYVAALDSLHIDSYGFMDQPAYCRSIDLHAKHVAISGDLMVIGAGIYDISNPLWPQLTGALSWPDHDPPRHYQGAEIFGDIAVTTYSYDWPDWHGAELDDTFVVLSGLALFDLQTQQVIVESDSSMGDAELLGLRYNYAYVNLNGLSVYDLPLDGTPPVIVARTPESDDFNPTDYFSEIRLDEEVVYAVTGEGLEVFVLPDAVAVGENPAPVAAGPPDRFHLAPVSPNPFNTTARVRIDLPATGRLRVALLNILGREVAVLADEARNAGIHTLLLDGSGFASGVYFVRAELPGHPPRLQKTVILK